MLTNRIMRIGDRMIEMNGKLVTTAPDIGPVQGGHIRLLFAPGTGPRLDDHHYSGTWTQLCPNPNIWDLWVYDGSTNWSRALGNAHLDTRTNIVEVIDADASGVTSMWGTFSDCQNIRSVGPLYNTESVVSCYEMFARDRSIVQVIPFDTRNVVQFQNMFYFNESLIVLPTLDTSSATDLSHMYESCWYAQGGIIRAYNEMISHGTNPTHYRTFHNCGLGTDYGKLELMMVPWDWK